MSAAIAVMMQTVIVIPPTVEIARDGSDNGESWQIIAQDGQFVLPDEEIKRGTIIAHQRLVPKQLAVVSGDIVRADGGDRWASAGDQLFGVKVGEHDAYCVLESKLNVTVGMLLVPTRTRLVKIDCFVDSDKDGRLDKRFEADPGTGTLPNVARSEPRAFYDLAPVEFRSIDPREFTDESWVEIEFRGAARRGDISPRFRISYRYDGVTRRLSDEFLAQPSADGNQLEVLGAQIEIQKDSDGKYSATVERPMASSFGVITSLKY